MKKIFYEKVGRRYVPVSEYDSDFRDSFRKGNHLVMCYPGGSTYMFNIDPDNASMIAAGRVARDAITQALVKASEIRPPKKVMTQAERDAWNNLIEVFGEQARSLSWSSASEIADAAINAMIDNAKELKYNPVVQNAYDHFELICKLAKEKNNDYS